MGFGFQQVAWFCQNPTTYTDTPNMGSGGPFFILPIKPAITLKKTISRIATEQLKAVGAAQADEDQLGLVSVEGGLSGVVPYSGGFHVLLKNITGKCVTAGVATPYTRTYTWVEALFPGLSIAVNRAGITYAYRGCQIASLKLSGTVGGPVPWEAQFIGRQEDLAATITPPAFPTNPTYPYLLFAHGAFTIDAVSVPITSFDLTFTNELESSEEKSYKIGSELRACLARSGYGAKGTIKRRHYNDGSGSLASKLYDKFLSGATAALILTFTNPSSADYAMKIVLPYVKFEGNTPEAGDRGFIPEDVPFTAYGMDSIVGGTYIETKNAIATPAAGTETGTYDGAGA